MSQEPAPHILVVDDEPAIRFSLGAFLEDCGYSVALAESGARARQIFLTSRIDKALVDMRLPDVSGEELILELAARHPQTEFFVFTGSLEYVPPPSLLHVGITPRHILRKPLPNLDELLLVLGLTKA